MTKLKTNYDVKISIAKYNPMIDEINLAGVNLVMKDNMTGDAHNSPIVWNKKAKKIQCI